MLPNVNPPTDSLYKFWTIIALVLSLFFGFKLFEYKSQIDSKKLDVIELEFKVDSIIAKNSIEDTSDFSKVIAKNETTLRKVDTTDPIATSQFQETLIAKTYSDFIIKIDEVKLKINSLNEKQKRPYENQINRIREETDLINNDKEWVIVAFIGCLIILTAGFIMWYKKDQYYKDKILKSDVLRKLREQENQKEND